ncbi:unnamed protein product, partial [Didymodactylos carnosus]
STNSIWFSVEYRLSPEYKYPIWLNDCIEVTKYIIENKTLYGETSTKVGVAGDSAGGAIAAVICHTLKNIDFQILVYPLTNMLASFPSSKRFTDVQYGLIPILRHWFNDNAIRDGNDMRDARVSVIFQSSFTGLPPCLFIVAELDPLLDDKYQKLLDKAGIKTKLVLIKGVIHSFFHLPGIFPKSCQQAVEAIRDFVAQV